jgi:hypothetical protein
MQMDQPHQLTKNFQAFFRRLNPSPTYVGVAASAHRNISTLMEDREGPAGDLQINCFLQGSYRRNTAIYTINDVDIVALCSLAYKPTSNQRTRDQIFKMIADAISVDQNYKDKVCYQECSICLKVLLGGIKVEILPTLREKGQSYAYEPFYMFRPDENLRSAVGWRQAYARYHQELCSEKNASTNGLFIPLIKVLKHLRSSDSKLANEDAVSFHVECLLYAIRDQVYDGRIGRCIEAVLQSLAGFDSHQASISKLKSPCKDKSLFSPEEWELDSYSRFHDAACRWYAITKRANNEKDRDSAIDIWKTLLGENYFPRNPQ